MRTTLTLDDDIAQAAAKRAKLRRVTLGKAVSELARRGLQAATRVTEKNGLFIFELPPDSPRVTTEQVKRLEAETL